MFVTGTECVPIASTAPNAAARSALALAWSASSTFATPVKLNLRARGMLMGLARVAKGEATVTEESASTKARESWENMLLTGEPTSWGHRSCMLRFIVVGRVLNVGFHSRGVGHMLQF